VSLPTGNQILSNRKNMTYSSRNPYMKVVITALILSVFFATLAQAQFSPPLNAQESAAQQYVAAMNKAQQAYYAKNRGFTSSISNLELRIKPDPAHYKYSIEISPHQNRNYVINRESVVIRESFVFNYAIPNQFNLRGWVGGVLSRGNKTQTILCVNLTTGPPFRPTISSGGLACGVNTRKFSQ